MSEGDGLGEAVDDAGASTADGELVEGAGVGASQAGSAGCAQAEIDSVPAQKIRVPRTSRRLLFIVPPTIRGNLAGNGGAGNPSVLQVVHEEFSGLWTCFVGHAFGLIPHSGPDNNPCWGHERTAEQRVLLSS